ncbi:MAG: hypothetical protein WC494_03140 [Candidatus Pacearchaeota archaeon]
MGKIDILPIKIQKLFLQGKIDSVYERIYNVAEKLAVHEMKQRGELIVDKASKKFDIQKNKWAYIEEMVKYKEKRIQHHINEMKELLKLREEVKK